MLHEARDGAANTAVSALEELEAGDVRGAEAILLGSLEDGPNGRPYSCGECGSAYEWPGLLDRHKGLAHGEAA